MHLEGADSPHVVDTFFNGFVKRERFVGSGDKDHYLKRKGDGRIFQLGLTEKGTKGGVMAKRVEIPTFYCSMTLNQ